MGRALAQISAQEAVERSKQGKALFPSLNGGSTNEDDVAQTEADAKQAFSLDSLGDPMCASPLLGRPGLSLSLSLYLSPPSHPLSFTHTHTHSLLLWLHLLA